MAATNDDSVIDALRDFALTSQENEIVEASVYALSKHTGDRAVTVLGEIAANSGKPTALRRLAISSIASRPGEPAVDALLRIYDTDQTLEMRKSVINGLGNRKSERAGAKLEEIVRGSDVVELRKAAISAISRRGGAKVIDTLLSLYDTEKNEELKDQLVERFYQLIGGLTMQKKRARSCPRAMRQPHQPWPKKRNQPSQRGPISIRVVA